MMPAVYKPRSLARHPPSASAGVSPSFFSLALTLFLLLPISAMATVLLQLSLEELVARSPLIVEGEVTARETLVREGQLYTRLVLRVDDSIKGARPGMELELMFLGGSSAGASLEVVGQFVPELQARGLFFIRDPLSELVNPLTGWQQGYFAISDPGSPNAWLDLTEHPELLLAAVGDDARIRKMLGLGLGEADIAAKYPEYQRFSAADFKAVLHSLVAEQGE